MTPRHTGHSFKPDMVTYSSLAGHCLIERCIMTSVPSLSCLLVILYCRGNDGPKGWGEGCRNFSQRESPNLYNKHNCALGFGSDSLISFFKTMPFSSPPKTTSHNKQSARKESFWHSNERVSFAVYVLYMAGKTLFKVVQLLPFDRKKGEEYNNYPRSEWTIQNTLCKLGGTYKWDD